MKQVKTTLTKADKGAAHSKAASMWCPEFFSWVYLGRRGGRVTNLPPKAPSKGVALCSRPVMVMVMVIFSALVRSHQSTLPVASASCVPRG